MSAFNEELCSISRIHQIDVALYRMNGELLLSSNMALVDEGILPPRLPELVHSRRNQILSISDPSRGDRELLLYTAEINNELGLPVALMVVPYSDKVERPMEDMAFFRALAWLHLVLFVAATYFAYLLSRSITQGLEVVGNAMKGNPEDGSSNPHQVAWRSKDEIGQLVDAYNRMVQQTEENAKALANAEKERAWREMAQQVAHEIKNNGPLRPVDLATMLRRIQLAYPGLDLALPAGPWMVLGTEDSLLRVFNNLLNNALDAIPQGKQPNVSVTVREDEGHILVSVRDNGSGIAPERWEAIFAPHFTTKSTGTGLGLALVKSIVAGMGGRIWIESSSPEGSVFMLRLPRA